MRTRPSEGRACERTAQLECCLRTVCVAYDALTCDGRERNAQVGARHADALLVYEANGVTALDCFNAREMQPMVAEILSSQSLRRRLAAVVAGRPIK